MAGVKDNRRTIYTKKIIRETLLELLEEKQIHEITVTDICKRADLNRGTFYTHYKDAFDLLQNMEDDFFCEVTECIDSISISTDKNLLMLKVLELIKENQTFCKILLGKQKDSRIISRIFEVANKVGIEKVIIDANKFNKVYLEYLIRYTVTGTISIVETWLQNGLKESPEEIVSIMNDINNVIYYIQNK